MRNSLGALAALALSIFAWMCTGFAYGANQTSQRIIALTLPAYPHSSMRHISSSWDEVGGRGVTISQQTNVPSSQALIYYLPWLQDHQWKIKDAKIWTTPGGQAQNAPSFEQLQQLLRNSDIYSFTVTFSNGNSEIIFSKQDDGQFAYSVM